MAPVVVTRPRSPRYAPTTPFITSAPVEVGPQAPELGVVAIGLGARGVAKKVVAAGGSCRWGMTGRAAPETITNPTTSTSFTHITITRNYDLATGAAPTGFVSFTPSAWMVNNGVTVVAAQRSATLDTTGAIRISLAANTDPGTLPTDSYYLVEEDIVGQPRRTYQLRIPHDLNTPLDLGGFSAAYAASPTPGYGVGGYGTSGYGA